MRRKLVLVSVLSMLAMSTVIFSGCGKKETPENLQQSNVPTSAAALSVVDTEDNYVGKIGDEKVTQSEFYFFLNQIKLNMENTATQGGNTDKAKYWATKIDGKAPIDIAVDDTISRIKELKIGSILGKKDNISLTQQEKDNASKQFDDFIVQNGGKDSVEKTLKTELGINFDQYKALNGKFALVDKVFKKIQDDLVVGDEEATIYYNENKATLDTVTVSHVLFLTTDSATNQPLPQEKQDQAKKNAEEVLAKVNAGEDITQLAQTRSEDPGVKQNNGEYVFSKNGQMVKEFEDWAFSNKVGATGIVKTSYGYHVMKKKAESTKEEGIMKAKKELQQKKTREKIDALKADPKYNFVKNEKVYNNLKL